MKAALCLLFFCALSLPMLRGQSDEVSQHVLSGKSSEGYGFDPQEKAISAIFDKVARRQTIETERQTIASLIDPQKTDQYMKAFSDGMDSNTGVILMEGEESQWLEKAYRAGYMEKLNFMMGYLRGQRDNSK